jgi:hypothetical protein
LAGRIFPDFAPQDAALPYATVSRIAGERVKSLRGPSGLSQSTYQIDCHAATRTAVRSLGDRIVHLLDTLMSEQGGDLAGLPCRACGVDGQNDFHEPPLHAGDSVVYGVSIDVTIWFRE